MVVFLYYKDACYLTDADVVVILLQKGLLSNRCRHSSYFII